MQPLKTLIIDDEWLIRTELIRLLSQYPEIEIVGEAAHVSDAIHLIEQHHPDVIFLDIELSGETGFDLLEKTNITCDVIFVTAYNQYAIRAFEVNALDYILKPFQKERFDITIQRLLKQKSLKKNVQGKLTKDDIIYVSINNAIKFLKISSLKIITACGNYTDIFYENGKKDMVNKMLSEWETILPKPYFLRIHRSTIVNFEYVIKVESCRNKTYLVYIKDEEKPFSMSRRHAAILKKQFVW